MANDLDLSKLEAFMKLETKKFTPEYFEELSRKCYIDDREYPENFSNWYPHIIDFGEFEHTNIIANQIFTFEESKLMQKTDNVDNVDWDKINEILKPTLDKLEPYKIYNIKNGCFSNKFDFSTCMTTKADLAKNLWKINYQSCMFETGGYTELVVREAIPYSLPTDNITIYNGMPLREEVRVFYNMNTKQIEYMVDYWDYNYCANNIQNKTDKIIFDYFHNKISGNEIDHSKALMQIETMIQSRIDSLKFDDYLTGIWSIDFLYEHNENKIYLIDMARGFRSAYWDTNKLMTKEV